MSKRIITIFMLFTITTFLVGKWRSHYCFTEHHETGQIRIVGNASRFEFNKKVKFFTTGYKLINSGADKFLFKSNNGFVLCRWFYSTKNHGVMVIVTSIGNVEAIINKHWKEIKQMTKKGYY